MHNVANAARGCCGLLQRAGWFLMVVAQFGKCCTWVLQRITMRTVGPNGCCTIWAVLHAGVAAYYNMQAGSYWLLHNVGSVEHRSTGVAAYYNVRQCAGWV